MWVVCLMIFVGVFVIGLDLVLSGDGMMVLELVV